MPPRTVAEYIATRPPAERRVLARVCATIRSALPGCDAVIAYGMPAFVLAGTRVIYVGAWKAHYSLYPLYSQVKTDLADALADHDVEKDTVRFSYDKPVPTALIRSIAKALATRPAARTPVAPRARTSRRAPAPARRAPRAPNRS